MGRRIGMDYRKNVAAIKEWLDSYGYSYEAAENEHETCFAYGISLEDSCFNTITCLLKICDDSVVSNQAHITLRADKKI